MAALYVGQDAVLLELGHDARLVLYVLLVVQQAGRLV